MSKISTTSSESDIRRQINFNTANIGQPSSLNNSFKQRTIRLKEGTKIGGGSFSQGDLITFGASSVTANVISYSEANRELLVTNLSGEPIDSKAQKSILYTVEDPSILSVGDSLTGATSGATAKVFAVNAASKQVIVHTVTDSFLENELIGSLTVAAFDLNGYTDILKGERVSGAAIVWEVEDSNRDTTTALNEILTGNILDIRLNGVSFGEDSDDTKIIFGEKKVELYVTDASALSTNDIIQQEVAVGSFVQATVDSISPNGGNDIVVVRDVQDVGELSFSATDTSGIPSAILDQNGDPLGSGNGTIESVSVVTNDPFISNAGDTFIFSGANNGNATVISEILQATSLQGKTNQSFFLSPENNGTSFNVAGDGVLGGSRLGFQGDVDTGINFNPVDASNVTFIFNGGSGVDSKLQAASGDFSGAVYGGTFRPFGVVDTADQFIDLSDTPPSNTNMACAANIRLGTIKAAGEVGIAFGSFATNGDRNRFSFDKDDNQYYLFWDNVGIETKASLNANLIGNASTSSSLETARTITLSGGVSGSAAFDGSSNISIVTSLVGSVGSADSLTTPRLIEVSGDASGSTFFDGSQDVDIEVTIPTASEGANGLVEWATSGEVGDLTHVGNQVLRSKDLPIKRDTTNQSFVVRDTAGNFSGDSGRGTGSLDFQTLRSSESEIVSGDYSSAMGARATVSGNYAAHFGFQGDVSGNYAAHFGFRGVVSGQDAVHFGSNGVVNGLGGVHFGESGFIESIRGVHFGESGTIGIDGAAGTHFGIGGSINKKCGFHTGLDGESEFNLGRVLAGGKWSSTGEAQSEEVILRQSTNNATQTTMYIDANIDGASGGGPLVLADNSAYFFKIFVVGKRIAFAETASYEVTGMVYMNSNTISFGGIPTITTIHEDDSNWDVGLAVNNINKSLEIRVTGAASKSIHWVAHATMTKVGD